MEITTSHHNVEPLTYDRKSELKAFESTKLGVKGLIDAGLMKVPRIFVHEQTRLQKHKYGGNDKSKFSIPVIDLQGIDKDASARRKVIDEVGFACEKWGFFQVVNHGIPLNVLDRMLEGVRAFHEGDPELKKRFYTRDNNSMVLFNTNFDLYQVSASTWRDTLTSIVAPRRPNPEELPPVYGYGNITTFS